MENLNQMMIQKNSIQEQVEGSTSEMRILEDLLKVFLIAFFFESLKIMQNPLNIQ